VHNNNDYARLRAPFLAGVLASALWLTAAGAAEEHEPVFFFFQAEEFGYRLGDEDSFNWDAQGWAGGDFNKLWLKTKGERVNGSGVDNAEVQFLYSRLISDFWDFQAGIRYDFKPEPERFFGVIGFEGLAPYRFETNAALFVSDEGDVAARFETEYELLLTQKLILQPLLELNLAAQDDEERGIGSGINDLELALTLRYEVVREFAPYMGVNWERKFGATADFAREENEDVTRTTFMAGIRFWF
jgi:copper resistance protein B